MRLNQIRPDYIWMDEIESGGMRLNQISPHKIGLDKMGSDEIRWGTN